MSSDRAASSRVARDRGPRAVASTPVERRGRGGPRRGTGVGLGRPRPPGAGPHQPGDQRGRSDERARTGDAARLRERDPGGAVGRRWGRHGRGDPRAGVRSDLHHQRPVPGWGARYGPGIGLGIVAQSGGHVEVRSSPGAGAAFAVSLPRVDPTVAPEPEPEPEPPPRPTRILILEDEAELRVLLAEGLQAHGYQTRDEPTGADGLTLSDVDLQAFDVLVTDHVMPGPSRVDTARALTARHSALRVVVISGSLPPDERVRLPSGATYLPKPFSLAELIAAIDPGEPRSPAQSPSARSRSPRRPAPGRPRSDRPHTSPASRAVRWCLSRWAHPTASRSTATLDRGLRRQRRQHRGLARMPPPPRSPSGGTSATVTPSSAACWPPTSGVCPPGPTRSRKAGATARTPPLR